MGQTECRNCKKWNKLPHVVKLSTEKNQGFFFATANKRPPFLTRILEPYSSLFIAQTLRKSRHNFYVKRLFLVKLPMSWK